MTKIMRSFRLPADLVERFDKAAEVAAIDKTEVVEKAIRNFVEKIENGDFWGTEKLVVTDWLYAPELGKCQVVDGEMYDHDNETVLVRKWCSLKVLNYNRETEIDGKMVRYNIEDAEARFDFKEKKCTAKYRVAWIGGLVETKTIEFPIKWNTREDDMFVRVTVSQA